MASSGASARGIAAIVGVGPKLGRSIARKFAHEGYTVAILARDLGDNQISISHSSCVKLDNPRTVFRFSEVSNSCFAFSILSSMFLLLLIIECANKMLYTCREAVEVCGRDSEGGEITSVRNTN